MSKLMLVSDYDGTLKSDIKNLKLNIIAINKFRENGNIFALSTGRSYQSIKKECIKYNIGYDYLFCTDGIVLFDESDNVIYKNYLDNDVLTEINSTYHNFTDIKSIDFYNPYEITDLVFDNSIVWICLKLNFIHNIKKFCENIKEKYQDVKITKYGNYLIIKKDFDKSKGVEVLANRLSNEISRENIITVGDNYNDLSMLKEFNGYRMLSSYPFLYGKGFKITKEVHTLIKKLDNKK